MNIKFDKVFGAIEGYVDKIVFAVIGLLCLLLLWMYVVRSPYGVKVDSRTQGPGQIDRTVRQKAQRLEEKLNEPADPVRYDKAYIRDYEQLMQTALPDVSVAVIVPYPGVGQEVIQEDRLYALPKIPELAEVQAANMRGAAQLPEEEIRPDSPYGTVPAVIGDIDLVTVSAKLNVGQLYNNFMQSFMGPRLKSNEKDPRLAKPVFARLQLERRSTLDNGQWSDWQEVPPTRIETYRQLYLDLPGTLDQSQYGVEIWMTQYDRQEVQQELLQPPVYQFAVSRTEWMTPGYLKEITDIMERQAKLDKQKQLEERQKLKDTRDTRRPATARPQPTERPRQDRDRQPADRTMPGGMEDMGYGMPGAMPVRTPAKKEPTVEEVKKKFEKEKLTEKTRLESLPDPLLVWANDDTAEPGRTYQYRLRVGVFNPIAGKDWFQSEQAQYKNELVLWSGYSETTEPVTIPQRVYVFPTDVLAAKDGNTQMRGVTVEVMKYHMGRWRDHEFEVYPGEQIGYEVEDALDETETMAAGRGGVLMDYTRMGADLPEDDGKVDFSTGYTLVDVSSQVSWGTRVRPSRFPEMLVFDGAALRNMPVGQSNWDGRMKDDYVDLQQQMGQDVQLQNPGMMMPGMPGEMPLMPDRMNMYR